MGVTIKIESSPNNLGNQIVQDKIAAKQQITSPHLSTVFPIGPVNPTIKKKILKIFPPKFYFS